MISGDQWSETSMEHAKRMKSLADETNYTEYVSGDLHIIKGYINDDIVPF